MTPNDLNLTVESQEEYRAQDKDFLTSTLLKAFLENPRLFQKHRAGQIPHEEKKAFTDGTAAHTMMLEGVAEFDRRYAIKSLDGRTAEGKAWKEMVERESLIVLDEKTGDMLCRMWAEFQCHPVAPRLLSSGFPELVARADYLGYPCQVKVDWLHFGLLLADRRSVNVLIDYKTCKDVKRFFYDAKKLRYINSLSYYKEVLNLALPPEHRIDTVVVIFQEKKEPYTVGVWYVHINDLETARLENEDAILGKYNPLTDSREGGIIECGRTGIYPTGYEEIRTMELLKRR